MRRKAGVVVSVLFGAVALVGPRVAPAADVADWTVLLYFGGDAPDGQSSLEPSVMDRIVSLLDADHPPSINIVALVDRAGADDTTIPIVNVLGATTEAAWVGAKFLQLLPRRAVEIEAAGALDLGSPGPLDRLLTIGRERFKAHRYALAIKGHARADVSIGVDASLSDGAPDPLSIAELHGALAGFERARESPMELLVLDGCGSATVDTLGALSQHAQAIVASADLLFARSVPYRPWIEALATDAGATPLGAAAACVRSYPEAGWSRANLPLVCPPSSPYGTLAAVDAEAAGNLRDAFDALGREALRVLNATDSEGAQRLGLARTRAFRFMNSTETHFDAAHVADEIGLAIEDPDLDAAAQRAGGTARAVAAVLSRGADLAGTCGVSVCWPCRDGAPEYAPCPLWADRGWPAFVKAFEEKLASCGSFTAAPNDLTTSVEAGPRAVVRSLHADGPADDAPYVGKRTFVVKASRSCPDARFLVPFASPPLRPDELSASAEFENAWAYGRIVLSGEAVEDDGPAWVECPIEAVQVLPGTDFRFPVTLAALTSPLRVTLPSGWEGDVQMRMTLTQGGRVQVLHPGRTFLPHAPGLGIGRRWIGRWQLAWNPWTPKVVCAFAVPSSAPPPPNPVPLSLDPRPAVAMPKDGSPRPPILPPKGETAVPETPRMIVFPDGTEIRTIRRIVDGAGVRFEYGPVIRLRTGRGCVEWRRFVSGDKVTVGHIERLADRRERDCYTDVTVP